MEQDSYAKVNIFLKVTGKEGGYHTLFSRFVLIKNLSDTIIWQKQDHSGFITTFETSLPIDKNALDALNQDNTILKAKRILEPYLTKDQKQLLEHTAVHVVKRVPMAAGLGGGSANAATFLRLAQKELEINLSDEIWLSIAKAVGADVAFFWSGYLSANVSGIGEHIVPFDENVPALEILTPPVACHTAQIYKHYSQHFLETNPCSSDILSAWTNQSSADILAENKNRVEFLNDLSLSVFALYPELRHYADERWFLSGSGSSFFRLMI